jgi:hypothetical protein
MMGGGTWVSFDFVGAGFSSFTGALISFATGRDGGWIVRILVAGRAGSSNGFRRVEYPWSCDSGPTSAFSSCRARIAVFVRPPRAFGGISMSLKLKRLNYLFGGSACGQLKICTSVPFYEFRNIV